MYATNLQGVSFSSQISVLGVKFSVNDVRNTLCRVFRIPCDCQSILAIPENRMIDYVIDMMAELVEPYLGGASCSSDLVSILQGSLSVGFGSSGVSIDIDAAALAKSALCNIAKYGLKQSREFLRPAATIVAAIRGTCTEELRASGSTGVSVDGRYSNDNPVIPPVPQQQPATVILSNDGGWGIMSTKTARPKSDAAPRKNIVPLVAISGVAIAVSAVILFKRR